jgi:hypothetical protein
MDDSNGSGVKPTFAKTPPLRIKADLLKVRSVPYDEAGQKVEPEQQPAARVMVIDGGAPVSMSRDQRNVGSIPASIIAETTAGEVANTMRSKCFQCKNFNTSAWKKLRLLWGNSSDPDVFQKLNRVRYALLTTQNPEVVRRSEGMDGDFDVEHSISQLGVCEPLTEINRDAVIVSPISTCPDEVCTKDNPRGLFVPKDKEMERLGSAAFDQIMRMAEGKAGGTPR